MLDVILLKWMIASAFATTDKIYENVKCANISTVRLAAVTLKDFKKVSYRKALKSIITVHGIQHLYQNWTAVVSWQCVI